MEDRESKSLAKGKNTTADDLTAPNGKDISNSQHEEILAVSLTASNISRFNSWVNLPSLQRIVSSVLDEPVTSRPWKAGIIQYGPLSGIFCMIVAMSSIFVSLGILAGSDGAATKDWKATPSTYLAICTAVANLAMRYACFQGVVTAWWSRALQGSSVAKLHYDWRAGTSLRGAITSGRNMGLLALACIFSTIVIVDGPLLQKATSVRLAPFADYTNLNLSLVQELPRGVSGTWGKTVDGTVTFRHALVPSAINNGSAPNNIITSSATRSSAFLGHNWLFSNPETAAISISGCPSVCQAKIRAPALAQASCKSFLSPFNGTKTLTTAQVDGEAKTPLESIALMIYFLLQLDEGESIDLITGTSKYSDFIGTLNLTACNLVSAVGEYDVKITKDPPSISSSWIPKIIALANNTRVDYNGDKAGLHPSTLGGIVSEMTNKWATNVLMGEEYGVIVVQEETPSGYHFTPEVGITKDTGYYIRMLDPHDMVMRDLNKLMFLTGVWASTTQSLSLLEARLDKNLAVSRNVTGFIVGEHNVFHTDFYWFVAAAAVELACIFLILPTYWGWWKLGRQVSFSPIELAKAFQSPIFKNCNSNSTGKNIAETYGDTRLRYGAVQADGKRVTLAFASPSLTDLPTNGSHLEA